MAEIINFAHRGAAGHCPENTMASFARALELGATGIETDVQMTRDGKLVLIHDESLQRTAGTPEWIKDITLEEARQCEVGSWFHKNYAGESIPTLEELLELVRGTDTIINLELKTGVVLYPGIEQKVIDAVRRFGLAERTIISSFNHYSLVECKKSLRTSAPAFCIWKGCTSLGITRSDRGRRAACVPVCAHAGAGCGGQRGRGRLSPVYGERSQSDARADSGRGGGHHYGLSRCPGRTAGQTRSVSG